MSYKVSTTVDIDESLIEQIKESLKVIWNDETDYHGANHIAVGTWVTYVIDNAIDNEHVILSDRREE
jgi:hypothetical protein